MINKTAIFNKINYELTSGTGVYFLKDFYDRNDCIESVKKIDNALSGIDLSKDKLDNLGGTCIEDVAILSSSSKANFLESRYAKHGYPLIQTRGLGNYDHGFIDIWNPDIIFTFLEDKVNYLKYIMQSICGNQYKIMFNLYITKGVKNTRCFHRDKLFNTNQLVKFFLYLSDVDLRSGPYAYILNSQSNCICKPKIVRPANYSNFTCICKNEEYDIDLIKDVDYNAYVGKAGSLIISNQSGLHKGME